MKNIKTKGLLFAATMFAAQVATAGYLLFEVETDYEGDSWYASIYSSADNAVSSDDTLLTSDTGATLSDGSTYSSSTLDSSFFGTVSPTTAAIVDSDSTTFKSLWYYVSVYDYDGTLVALSDLVSGETLADANTYLSVQNLSYAGFSGTQEYTFSATTANLVPEPTGGLLVLMGAALLGLRRKRLA